MKQENSATGSIFSTGNRDISASKGFKGKNRSLYFREGLSLRGKASICWRQQTTSFVGGKGGIALE
jgi:hypothetical protein